MSLRCHDCSAYAWTRAPFCQQCGYGDVAVAPLDPTRTASAAPVPAPPSRRGAVAAGLVVLVALLMIAGGLLIGRPTTSYGVDTTYESADTYDPYDTYDTGTVATVPTTATGSPPAGVAPTAPGSTARPSTTLGTVSDPRPLSPSSVSATCQSPSGVDSQDNPQSYEPYRATDGDPETTWRCDGDATGQSLELTFSSTVHVSSIALIPGFAKVDRYDGADRFAQNRKITSVTYQFDGGETVRATFSPSPSLQPTSVNVLTRRITITIAGTSLGSTTIANDGTTLGAIDKTPISEIDVLGATI